MTFFSLGAPFAGALEVIAYAGAIMVLFVFVVMMLNLGPAAAQQERIWLTPGIWIGPVILAALLLATYLWPTVEERRGVALLPWTVVGGDAVVAQLAHRAPVAHHEAVEAPLVSQHLPHQERVGRGRNAVQVAEQRWVHRSIVPLERTQLRPHPE